jgi:hypothetical protein
MSKSSKPIVTPRAACSPSMRPASSAISTLTGWDHKVAAEFFCECSSPVAVGVISRSVNAMDQFNDCQNREGAIDFPVYSAHSFEVFLDSTPWTLPGDEHAGV